MKALLCDTRNLKMHHSMHKNRRAQRNLGMDVKSYNLHFGTSRLMQLVVTYIPATSNPASVISIHKSDWGLSNNTTANSLERSRARPLAGTVLIMKSNMFSSIFVHQWFWIRILAIFKIAIEIFRTSIHLMGQWIEHPVRLTISWLSARLR